MCAGAVSKTAAAQCSVETYVMLRCQLCKHSCMLCQLRAAQLRAGAPSAMCVSTVQCVWRTGSRDGGRPGSHRRQGWRRREQIKALYHTFADCDCTMVEVCRHARIRVSCCALHWFLSCCVNARQAVTPLNTPCSVHSLAYVLICQRCSDQDCRSMHEALWHDAQVNPLAETKRGRAGFCRRKAGL